MIYYAPKCWCSIGNGGRRCSPWASFWRVLASHFQRSRGYARRPSQASFSLAGSLVSSCRAFADSARPATTGLRRKVLSRSCRSSISRSSAPRTRLRRCSSASRASRRPSSSSRVFSSSPSSFCSPLLEWRPVGEFGIMCGD